MHEQQNAHIHTEMNRISNPATPGPSWYASNAKLLLQFFLLQIEHSSFHGNKPDFYVFIKSLFVSYLLKLLPDCQKLFLMIS